MLTKKFFARGTDPVLSSTSPTDHVQYLHEGYREFPSQKAAEDHVNANKAAQSRRQNADTDNDGPPPEATDAAQNQGGQTPPGKSGGAKSGR